MTGNELAQLLIESRLRLLQEAAEVPISRLSERLSSEEWSVLEVLAHLVDVDYHWLSQALAMKSTPGYMFLHFDDDKWKAEHLAIRESPPEQILTDLDASHRSVVEPLLSITEEELYRSGRHPRGIPYRVIDVFLRYLVHDLNHTQQIHDIRQRLKR
ncbi:MAG: DinB 2 protein [Dehalococcoidia bacterium]|nr:DinB 2 protein [Dehalococcoidia bacterium]